MLGKKPNVSAKDRSVAVAGDNINSPITINDRDPLDRQLIESLLVDKERLLAENNQLRDQVTEAVIGLSSLDSEPSMIDEARAALTEGDTEQAQALYRADAKRKAIVGKEMLQEAAESYRRLGALAFLNDSQTALDAYQNAVKVWPDDIDAWNQLGHLYRRTGQLDQAIEASRNVEVLASSTDMPESWTAASFGNLGIIYQIRGELDLVDEMFEKALAINEALGYQEGMANSYGNLGIVYQIRGELDRADEMFEKALAINEALGYQAGMANQYGNLGTVYRIRGELDRADELYEKALAINEALGRQEGMAIQYGNLGNVYQTRGELDRAVELYEKALAINEALGRQEGMAIQYGNLGIIYQSRGELDRAVELYENALAIDEALGYKEGMANDYGNLGNVYRIRGELDQARMSWEQSAELFEAMGSPHATTVRSWIDELGAK